MSELGSLGDDELNEIADELAEMEKRLSRQRRSLHEQIDQTPGRDRQPLQDGQGYRRRPPLLRGPARVPRQLPLPDHWRELGEFIREQRNTARLSLRRLSELAGISNPYLSQIERGLRKPSAEILQQIAKALRISAETLYVQAGILEPTGGDDVQRAVLADTQLSEEQKQALLQIYLSFRHEQGERSVATEAVPGSRLEGPPSRLALRCGVSRSCHFTPLRWPNRAPATAAA